MASSSVNNAAVMTAIGSPLSVQQRDVPTPGPDGILVRNRAVALNPADHKRLTLGLFCPSMPTILGIDYAGEVVAVGSNVTTLQPGDRVLAASNEVMTANRDNGGFQEYVSAVPSLTSRIPDDCSFAEAATLPSSVITVVAAMHDYLGIPVADADFSASSLGSSKPGIIIWGGSSSVGSVAIQLARMAGLTVFTTASPKHHAEMHRLGATFAVDYRYGPMAIAAIVAEADKQDVQIRHAIDCISSAETLPRVTEILRHFTKNDAADAPKPKLAHTVQWPETDLKAPEDVDASWIMPLRMYTSGDPLATQIFGGDLCGWIKEKSVLPKTHRIVGRGLENIQKAVDEIGSGSVSGEKLVVEL